MPFHFCYIIFLRRVFSVVLSIFTFFPLFLFFHRCFFAFPSDIVTFPSFYICFFPLLFSVYLVVYAHRTNKKKSAWIFTKAALIADQRFSCAHLGWRVDERERMVKKIDRRDGETFIIIHIEFSCLVFNFDVYFFLFSLSLPR